MCMLSPELKYAVKLPKVSLYTQKTARRLAGIKSIARALGEKLYLKFLFTTAIFCRVSIAQTPTKAIKSKIPGDFVS